jgi:hypothetical protein
VSDHNFIWREWKPEPENLQAFPIRTSDQYSGALHARQPGVACKLKADQVSCTNDTLFDISVLRLKKRNQPFSWQLSINLSEICYFLSKIFLRLTLPIVPGNVTARLMFHSSGSKNVYCILPCVTPKLHSPTSGIWKATSLFAFAT